MRNLISLIVVFAGACAAAGEQGSTALPEQLRAHVKDDRFQPVTSIRGLPLGVRDALGELIKGQYTDFAEPGAPFKATDADAIKDAWLPERRLVAAACANDHHCIVYYQRGGKEQTWHVAVFQWTPDATQLEFGGTAPAGLESIDAVRAAILSGAIKSGTTSW